MASGLPEVQRAIQLHRNFPMELLEKLRVASHTRTYTPGSSFAATFEFDDSFADSNPDPKAGSFLNFGTATTALKTTFG